MQQESLHLQALLLLLKRLGKYSLRRDDPQIGPNGGLKGSFRI